MNIDLLWLNLNEKMNIKNFKKKRTSLTDGFISLYHSLFPDALYHALFGSGETQRYIVLDGNVDVNQVQYNTQGEII